LRSCRSWCKLHGPGGWDNETFTFIDYWDVSAANAHLGIELFGHPDQGRHKQPTLSCRSTVSEKWLRAAKQRVD